MMRSMYAGVSGLRNHQIRMDVIGNNIANVNTAGYKKSRVVFKDTLYQSIRGASRPTDARGGTNPMGVGLGMTISSVDQIHTPAPATITNKTTDLAVDGNGYFLLDNGGQVFYTRAGNFDFDKMGNLVSQSNGYRVHGWMADKNQYDTSGNWKIDTVKASEPIDISAYKTVEPKATTSMKFTGNLSSKTELAVLADGSLIDPSDSSQFPADENQVIITSKDMYDSLGNKQTIYFRFFKYEDGGDLKWASDISLSPDFEKDADYANLEVIDLDTEDQTIEGADMVRVTGITFDSGGFTVDNPILKQLTIDRESLGAEDIKLDIDFSQITQWETKSTAWAEHQNGYSMGNLVSYTIGIDGTIQGVYDNGETRNLARVALVNFQNPAGLIQAGSNLYQVSNNSGDPLVGAPGDQGMGAILPGSLEMSNVDLSEEFTDMIVTQRGFQANSRVITTSDEMLQELVNLKR